MEPKSTLKPLETNPDPIYSILVLRYLPMLTESYYIHLQAAYLGLSC